MTGLAAPRDRVQAGDLLDLWERVAPLASMERALALAAGNLGAGDSNGADTTALRRQPVGHIYARLLELRERLWGPSLQAVATCPRCASRVEFVLMTTDLLSVKPGQPRPDFVDGERVVKWRPPTLEDLLAVADTKDDPALALASRCLSVTTLAGDQVQPDALPKDVWQLLDDVLADADPWQRSWPS
jgi:hypothetical protein